ncbi:MAG: hypothetical protein IBX45_02620 [Campylobacterales bacterium]|nr:hypothetical protein [Campylobacterales bacterium]
MATRIRVPQEPNATLEGIQKVMYATDEQGNFHKYNYGSSVEEFATKVAVEEYEYQQHMALEQLRQGDASPLLYYMYANRMDVPTLASAVGFFAFRVKRHLRMKHFKKLNDATLGKYAALFNLSLQELKDFS